MVREFSEKGISLSITVSKFFSNQPQGHRHPRNPEGYFLRETRLGHIVENYDRPRIHDDRYTSEGSSTIVLAHPGRRARNPASPTPSASRFRDYAQRNLSLVEP